MINSPIGEYINNKITLKFAYIIYVLIIADLPYFTPPNGGVKRGLDKKKIFFTYKVSLSSHPTIPY